MKPDKLLIAGVVAGPLFVSTVVVEGMARTGYSVLRHPISSLALGSGGWVQATAFIVAGLLSVLFAAGVGQAPGVRRGLGAALVLVWGICFVGVGVFTTDPVSGYPAGTPAYPGGTLSGTLHNLFALVGAIAMVIACVTLRSRGGRGWAVYSVLTGVWFGVTFVLAAVGFGQVAGLVEVAGLLERAAVFAIWAWLTLLAVQTLRFARRSDMIGATTA